MTGRMAVGVLVAFTAASASAGLGAEGRSGGGAVPRSGGAHFARGSSAGARYAGGPRGGHYGGGHAVPRGSVGAGYGRPPGAQGRHPRAGYGTGYYYRHGYGHYPSYGYYPYYGRYPYYGGYYYPYGWGLGLGLSFYYGGGYPYYGGGYPYYGGYAPTYYYGAAPGADVSYYGGEEPSGYANDAGRSEAAELQLVVVPDDASVWIDDEFRGVARDLARMPLPPGRHRIEVVRPGFRTAAQEVDLRSGTPTSLRIELERP